MAKLSKIEHDALIALDPADLTNEDRRDIIDFEREEAKAPSLDDVEWASAIHDMATKNPSTDGIALKETGDYDKALKILEQERAYNAIKGGQANKNYVQPVKRIPDDLNSEFNFNWKSAYENVKNEKLRDTEADYDKLKKFIDSNMYDLDDPTTLQKIAHDLHMYNSNTMKWTDFINSEQGEEFKKYLADVRDNQRKNAINDIFDNESNVAVDFGFPVAKESARKALLNNENPELGLPLAFDFGTNAAMFVGGKPGLVMAPFISNFGQAVSNDLDPAVAAINTVLGAGTNAVTPYVMSRGGRYFKTPGKNYLQKTAVQDRANVLAKEIGDTENKLKSGALHSLYSKVPKLDNEGNPVAADVLGYVNENKKILYTDDATKAIKEYGLKGYTIKPLEEARKHDAGIITDDELRKYATNKDIARNNWLDININPRKAVQNFKEQKAISDKRNENLDKLYERMNRPDVYFVNKEGQRIKKPSIKPDVNKILSDLASGKKISDMNMRELYALGYKPKESVLSFLWRTSPDLVQNYFTNFMGRTVPAGATMRLPNMLLGTDLNKFIKEKKNEKPKISEIFGGE